MKNDWQLPITFQRARVRIGEVASDYGARVVSDSIELSGYAIFIEELKTRVQDSHIKAVRAVNRELILLYWNIAAAIVRKQSNTKWDDSVVDRIASDVSAEFPDMSVFSSRNMRDMKRMWITYSDQEFWHYLAIQYWNSGLQHLLRVHCVVFRSHVQR